MRIMSKTVHDINKSEDNFALHYVFTYPDIISCAEFVPLHNAIKSTILSYYYLHKSFKSTILSYYFRASEKSKNIQNYMYQV
jgi:hypothetical protein